MPKPNQLHEQHPEGGMQGKDPRKLSASDLEAAGLTKLNRGDAIRANCLDCAGSSPAEVRRCALTTCPLWPFRMGTDPWRATMSDEARQAAAERLKKGRAKAS